MLQCSAGLQFGCTAGVHAGMRCVQAWRPTRQPVYHPNDKKLSSGTPVYHPNDKEPTSGTPVYHPNAKEPSSGTPVWRPALRYLLRGAV